MKKSGKVRIKMRHRNRKKFRQLSQPSFANCNHSVPVSLQTLTKRSPASIENLGSPPETETLKKMFTARYKLHIFDRSCAYTN